MTQPSQAKYVIVGGGAIGCGIAYSLAAAGETDVVLLEKEPTLAAVTTSQAAGLVGQVRASVERVHLAQWSVETFGNLREASGTDPGWRQVGSLRVALCEARVGEFKRLKDVADEAGLETEFIDGAAAEQMWPGMNFSAAKAILWCPSDGYIQPSDLTMAYSAYARSQGAKFLTNTPLRKIALKEGRVAAVETSRGTIECEYIINAAGANAHQVAKAAGLVLPIIPIRHTFFVTVHADGLTPGLPVMRIPDGTIYLRTEVNSLLVGGCEREGFSTDPRDFDIDDSAPLIEDDWNVLAFFGDQLAPHFAALADLGIRSTFKGWVTFTPDGRFIIGESSRVPGFVMASGCSAHGVSGSAGIGRHVVESLLAEQPSDYVKSLSPDRFTETEWEWDDAARNALRRHETYYAVS